MTNHNTPVARWQARMGLTDRAAAAALGMTLAGYQRHKRGIGDKGKPLETDRRMLLACAAVECGIKPIS